jgi:hypothetical protein
MVWEITAGGVYKDLHDFGGTVTNSGGIEGPDGVSPIAGVTLDSAGNIFGTTLAGGPNNVNQAGGGIVWEITVAGGYKDVHDFGGTVINASGKKGPDGVEPAGLAFDKVGNLYGTTDFGGPNGAVRGSGIAWEITVAGKYKDLHDFGGTVTIASGKRGQDGGTPFGGVALDASGNLYGTADFGGANAGGMVWEITTVGVYKDLHDFGGKVTNADGKGGLDGLQPWSGVKFDAAGNMYGTTDNGGPNTIGNITAGIVWEITAAHVYKDLHDFGANVTNSDGSTGPDGNFPYYAGVTFDRSGNMFGTTQYGGAYSGGAGLVWEISAPPSLTVATVTLDPTTVVGGSKATGTVTLTGQAPVGGTLVKLSSNSTTAEVPASVKVESGKTTATFTVNTITVASNVTATVKATVGAAYQTANLTIEAPKLKALVLSPTSVIGGKSVLARLTLTSAAPVGGLTITVSSSSSGVTAPETVRVPAGATSATFTVKTKAVTTTTAETLSASLNGVSVTAGLTVKP